MVTTQVKRRRGTAAQCDAMIPAEGEIIYDTTNDRLRVGDGAEFGGFPLPNAFDMQKNSFTAGTTAGTADALTLTLSPAPASYTANMSVSFKAANTNTGAATLNINGLGAINLRKLSGGSIVALVAGDIVSGAYYTTYYDGTNFVIEAAGGGVTEVTGSGGITVSPTTGEPEVSIDTNNGGGVGAYAICKNVSGSLLSNGSTISGSSLRYVAWRTADSVIEENGTPSGTWRNISGGSLSGTGGSGEQNVGLFIRTA